MSKYQKSFHFGLGYVPKDFQIRDEVYIDESGYTSQPKETQLVQEINIPTIHTTSNLVSIPDIVYLPKEEVTTTFIDTPRPIIADVKPLINSNLLFTNQQVTVTPTTTGVVTGTKPITPVTTTNYTGTVNTTTKSISGKVIDEFGFPLQDVNVYSENDTYLGTATDKDGRFYLQNVPNQDQIVFSAVGYKSVSLPAYSVPSIVQLSSEIEELDEVVLTTTPTTPTTAKKTNWLLIGGISLGLLTVAAVIASSGKKQAALNGKFEKVEL